MLTRPQVVAEHFKTTGTPVGHGYNDRNLHDGTAYYSFDKGGVHYISLDTVNPNGYSDGSLDTAQLAWLERRLKAEQLALPGHERQLGHAAPAPTGSS